MSKPLKRMSEQPNNVKIKVKTTIRNTEKYVKTAESNIKMF